MMTFTVLLAIAAGIIIPQLWENSKAKVKPIRIESRMDELEQQRRHHRGR